MSIRPFKVDVPQDDVDRLKAKLLDTQTPDTEIVPDAGSDYGVYRKILKQHLMELRVMKRSSAIVDRPSSPEVHRPRLEICSTTPQQGRPFHSHHPRSQGSIDQA